MIWLARTVIIVLVTLDGRLFAATRLRRPPFITDFVMGFGIGLFVIGVCWLIGNLGNKISAKAPVGARGVGTALYSLGIAIAVYCLWTSANAAYQGSSGENVVMLASYAVAYWIGGWGLRRALTAN
jgi:hypothetical protein